MILYSIFMALFQKKLQTTENLPLYTVGQQQSLLVVGLGNSGKKYTGSRHNIGFEVLNFFGEKNDFPQWIDKRDLKCQLSIANLGATRMILCKPTTYMNLSGQAVRSAQQFYKLSNSQTLAVYDELAIPFGQLRTRLGGSDAGHNGVKSLIGHLGDDFYRLRVGIGSEAATEADAADFVLKQFSRAEQDNLTNIIKEAGALITEYSAGGQLPLETRKVL